MKLQPRAAIYRIRLEIAWIRVQAWWCELKIFFYS
jgi:hypothetical protein